jgi:hypothetical protein
MKRKTKLYYSKKYQRNKILFVMTGVFLITSLVISIKSTTNNQESKVENTVTVKMNSLKNTKM